MLGSLALSNQKGPRSHFLMHLLCLFATIAPHPTAASCLPEGRPTAQPCPLAGVSPLWFWLSAAAFHKSFWIPPPRPGSPKCLSLGLPVNPALK